MKILKQKSFSMEQIAILNKQVGKVLLTNRKRVGLTRTQVVGRVDNLTENQLEEIETGKKSLPCRSLYELLHNVYSPTQNEVLYFCCFPKGESFLRDEPTNDLSF